MGFRRSRVQIPAPRLRVDEAATSGLLANGSSETRLRSTPPAKAHPVQHRSRGLPDKPINVCGG